MSENKPSLLKQLGGAVVGMLIALAAYQGYVFLTPYFQPHLQASLAYLFPPGTTAVNPPSGDVRIADKKASDERVERIVNRARNIAKNLGGMPAETSMPAQPWVPEETTEQSAQDPTQEPVEVPVAEPEPSPVPSDPVTTEEHSSPPIAETYGEQMTEDGAPTSVSQDAAEGTGQTGSQKLPSSGVSLWLATLLALLPSLIAVPRVRRWVSVHARVEA